MKLLTGIELKELKEINWQIKVTSLWELSLPKSDKLMKGRFHSGHSILTAVVSSHSGHPTRANGQMISVTMLDTRKDQFRTVAPPMRRRRPFLKIALIKYLHFALMFKPQLLLFNFEKIW